MFNNKKIFILGLAKSGFACAKLLSKFNHEITVTDSGEIEEEKVKVLKDLDIQFIHAVDPIDLLDETYDMLVKNPGIRSDHPTVLKALNLNIPVINEMEVSFHFLPDHVEIIGITGSNGKTTTTSLTYEILKHSKKPVVLAGNIGIPLAEQIPSIKANSLLLCEISDHQLLNVNDFRCNTSVITNIVHTHLDFHGSFEKYKQTKANIFKVQKANDFTILNKANQHVLDISKNILPQKIYFNDELNYYDDEYIYINKEIYLNREDLVLKGNHNCENILVAILIAKKYDISDQDIKTEIKKFCGVSHRLEYIDKINEVIYYNDSKATNNESTKIALRSFNAPINLILGGEERNQDFNELTEDLGNVKHIFAIGTCRDRIKKYAEDKHIECTVNVYLKEAMKEIFATVKSKEVVLLSPGTGSWDQYKRFEDRGNEFVELVKEYAKKTTSLNDR